MDNYMIRQIADQYGTPCYIFDLDALRVRKAAIRDILDDAIGLCYSIKANPFLIPVMDEMTGLLEVCSPGELEICLQNGVNPDHILLSGVNKTASDMERALSANIRRFTCESLFHVALLESAAAEHDLILPVLLRLTAGSQFGMDASDLESVLSHRQMYPHLDIQGLHYFSGTQRKKLQDQRKELAFLSDYCTHLREDCNFEVRKIEYGTGLYFPYFENEDHSDTLSPIRELAPDLRKLSEQVSLTIEMGRFFASECGYYLTSVQDTKQNKGQWYAILDGGIHQLNYYGGSMGMRVPRITRIPVAPDASSETESWMLCGSLCTTADILVRSYGTPHLNQGDLLLFGNCGAYSITEAPALFLSRDMPAVLYLENHALTCVRPSIPSWKLNTRQS